MRAKRLNHFCCFLLLIVTIFGCVSSNKVSMGSNKNIYTFSAGVVNIHVIEDNGKYLLVDSGKQDKIQDLLDSLKKEEIDIKNVKAVVITHGHADHAGGAAYLKANFGIPIVAGVADKPMYSKGINLHICPTGHLFASESVKEDTYPSFQPDFEIEPGKRLDLSVFGMSGEIVSVPGHTPGSLVVATAQSIFIGDMFRGSILGNSAELHFYMCDIKGNIKDISNLLAAYPEADRFFTGHMGPVDRASVTSLVAKLQETYAEKNTETK